MKYVSSFLELQTAIESNEPIIAITRSFMALQSLLLPENIQILGIPQEDGSLPMILFSNTDAIGVTKNNIIKDLVIHTDSKNKAIFNIGTQSDLGSFHFENLRLSGQFSFILRAPSKSATIIINNVQINNADTRDCLEQPQKYGVNVLQGALTIYNFNPSDESLLTLSVTNISIGSKWYPVIGSGVFIAGFGDTGGKINLTLLKTNSIYSTGKIPFGVSDFITAGIFISTGVEAKSIIHYEEIITYGVNDMVLDNWGTVIDWKVDALVTSYGPSGVGFVNFGTVKNFVLTQPLQTYGLGA